MNTAKLLLDPVHAGQASCAPQSAASLPEPLSMDVNRLYAENHCLRAAL
jgi:hypothetical protein